MRGVFVFLAAVAAGGVAEAQSDKAPEAGPRYGFAADLKTYPQGTPREALASVLQAVDARRFDYVAAQLADPAFIDDRVQRIYGGRFEEQVEDTGARLDPGTVKLLRRFLKDGKWATHKGQASARLEDVPDRRVYLRQENGRWFLEHRLSPPAPKESPTHSLPTRTDF
jgi:hypothetical protein